MHPLLIVSFSLPVITISAIFFLIDRSRRRLDSTYQNALRAESTGEYVTASQIYQSLLDGAGFFSRVDRAARSQIKHRLDTLRYQIDWISQFTGSNDAKSMSLPQPQHPGTLLQPA